MILQNVFDIEECPIIMRGLSCFEKKLLPYLVWNNRIGYESFLDGTMDSLEFQVRKLI